MRLTSKGATIGVQLPLGVDEIVRRCAKAEGVSPGLWISARLSRAVVEDGCRACLKEGQGVRMRRPAEQAE